MSNFPSLCQNCIFQTRPEMITGYSPDSFPCDRCGRWSNLAIVEIRRKNRKNPSSSFNCPSCERFWHLDDSARGSRATTIGVRTCPSCMDQELNLDEEAELDDISASLDEELLDRNPRYARNRRRKKNPSAPKKWSKLVKTRKHPPKKLFAKGSAREIASWVRKAHTTKRSAMASINFYLNRAGKNLSNKRRATINRAKSQVKRTKFK